MRKTFQKYSSPENLGYYRSFEDTYLADEILEPVLQALREKASGTIQYVDFLKGRGKPLIHAQKWDWSSVMAFTEEVWSVFSSGYAAEIRKSFEEGKFRAQEITPGNITSFCTLGEVDMYLDGTLNDPVYTAHESGHLMAYRLASDTEDRDQKRNVCELQAFFIQEAAYDLLGKKATTEEQKLATRMHRLTEYVCSAAEIPFHLWVFGNNQDQGNGMSLRDSFHDWQVSDEAWLNCMQEWYEEEGDGIFRLHQHPFATLITPDLYQRYKFATPVRQKSMFDTLFTGGYGTTISDILEAFDIRNKKDLKQCALRTLSQHESDIRSSIEAAYHSPLNLDSNQKYENILTL